MKFDAVVLGSGPNGLTAGIVLAQAGRRVAIVEGQRQAGGALKTQEVTLPGFFHDLNASVFPMAMLSPILRSLPLRQHGVTWVQPPVPLAHPKLKDEAGQHSLFLYRDVGQTARQFQGWAAVYEQLMYVLLQRRVAIQDFVFQPMGRLPARPLSILPFAVAAGLPAAVVNRLFRQPDFALLFSGLAAHSAQPLEMWGTSAIPLMLSMAGHCEGWPMVRGGAARLAEALVTIFRSYGGQLFTDMPVKAPSDLPDTKVVLADVGPYTLAQVFGSLLPSAYVRQLRRFQYGPGVFKVDYALSDAVPWRDPALRTAGTLHVGHSPRGIATAERQAAQGQMPQQPFLIAAQPSLFDSTVAPPGHHTFWAYTHVPNGAGQLAVDRIEQQLEHHAPGFRDLVLARHVSGPVELQAANPNLVGGDVTGGANTLRQLIARPTFRQASYRTPLPWLYLCSASTPPGGGVHGMCGFHAAQAVLQDYP